MDEKVRFIADSRTEFCSFSELCRRYGVSRKTGYKWLGRYEHDGPSGLEERSRRPHSCPHATEAEIVEALMEIRREAPSLGRQEAAEECCSAGRPSGSCRPARHAADPRAGTASLTLDVVERALVMRAGR